MNDDHQTSDIPAVRLGQRRESSGFAYAVGADDPAVLLAGKTGEADRKALNVRLWDGHVKASDRQLCTRRPRGVGLSEVMFGEGMGYDPRARINEVSPGRGEESMGS